MSNLNKKVRVHYTGTFNDGTKFDSSYDRGQTLNFTCGAGQMIKGFDAAVAEMAVGDVVDIHLMPEEAYGAENPDLIFHINLEDEPDLEDLEIGDRTMFATPSGRFVQVKVTEKNDTAMTLNGNHDMAGKELNFHIELIEVK